MFGSAVSVWSYCRVAAFMTWLCRGLLLTPLLHFVDDFGNVETDDVAPSSFTGAQNMCRILGPRFKEVEAQPQRGSTNCSV